MRTLSIVIPVFNASTTLPEIVYGLRELSLPKGTKLAEVIFVNDGSTDDTFKLLKKAQTTVLSPLKKTFPKIEIKIITYRNKQGSGFATMQGIKTATADYTLALGENDAYTLHVLENLLKNTKAEVTLITAYNKTHTLLTKYIAQAQKYLTKTLLGIHTKQTNVTAILIKKRAKNLICTYTTIHGLGYSQEILFIAKQQSLLWKEKVLTIKTSPSAKKHFLPFLFVLSDLIQIKWHHIWQKDLKRAQSNLQESIPMTQHIFAKFV